MKINLRNIGKVESANIEINGISVIAGENNTGKSTVGRALYSVFNSFANINEKIRNERISTVEQIIDYSFDLQDLFNEELSDKEINIIINTSKKYLKDGAEKYDEFMQSVFSALDSKYTLDYLTKIIDKNGYLKILEAVKVNEESIVSLIAKKVLNTEFNNQIKNIFTDQKGYIELVIKKEKVKVDVLSDNEIVANFAKGFSLKTTAIYLDDPFVLDNKNYFFLDQSLTANHQQFTALKLKDSSGKLINEIIAKEKLKDIYSKLSSICGGEVVTTGNKLVYKKENSDKVLNVNNLSSGFKTFAILKTLLLNGTIEENGTLILDEPEIHLHPAWQLVFAELIVLIQKEFGVHVLLNTHSPYFLNAIETYSAKYGIADKCKYYLATTKNDLAHFEDVTNNIEAIYKKLARPLQDLENERYFDD